jgi:hypothetical protein
MTPNDRAKLHQALTATCLACSGREPSLDLLKIYEDALSSYDIETALAALRRCYKEHKGHLAPADIISRIPSGWPSKNEAWAMCPHSEADTVVWFLECAQAYDETKALSGDAVAQRMAFMEAYTRLVQASKDRGLSPKWEVCLGTDKTRREKAVRDAHRKGLITEKKASLLLPGWTFGTDGHQLPPKQEPKQIEGNTEGADPGLIRGLLSKMSFMDTDTETDKNRIRENLEEG